MPTTVYNEPTVAQALAKVLQRLQADVGRMACSTCETPLPYRQVVPCAACRLPLCRSCTVESGGLAVCVECAVDRVEGDPVEMELSPMEVHGVHHVR